MPTETVKCRQCSGPTILDSQEVQAGINHGLIENHGPVPGGFSNVRMLFWTCPNCQQDAISQASNPVPVELQMATINARRLRLEKAGKDRLASVDRAVSSQMNEYDRRHYPRFYSWLLDRDAETAKAAGAWQGPPAEYGARVGIPVETSEETAWLPRKQ